ncbi:MAG: BolA family transcriptional regulator [Polyangiaceae bacterium]|nr:BolA family transcriptional regulator [Polyangiaceae bacterium]
MKPSREEAIRRKLSSALAPVHLHIEDESRLHGVPPGSESHYKVLVVSQAFAGLGTLQRHRAVHELLREHFATGMHALSIRTMTPEEWERQGEDGFRSPPCMGGSKTG